LQSPLRGPLQKKVGRSGAASKDDTWMAASFILIDVRFTPNSGHAAVLVCFRFIRARVCFDKLDAQFVHFRTIIHATHFQCLPGLSPASIK
jgi:hypothetical protein